MVMTQHSMQQNHNTEGWSRKQAQLKARLLLEATTTQNNLSRRGRRQWSDGISWQSGGLEKSPLEQKIREETIAMDGKGRDVNEIEHNAVKWKLETCDRLGETNWSTEGKGKRAWHKES
ncbi:hypothetical protein PIB30_068184 [Stylosanthes scabra]|uniref:Uncharacterized protein n=1 Tax=Stylosanthes scabra TaxID=79078 RepID=A0ABU6TNK5_9FABA|nr:hypothetical protein [Stylosanthes scabra]